MDNRNDDKNYTFYRTVIGAILMIFVCAPLLLWRYGAGYGALGLVIGGIMAIAAVVQYAGIRKKKKENEAREEKKKK